MTAVVAFETLPLWRGVSRVPGVPEALPFQLAIHDLGFFIQDQPADLRKSLAEAYSRPDYQFITPPPGSSEWATALGKAKTDALTAACGALDGCILEIGAGNLTIAREIASRFNVAQYVAIDPAFSTEQDGQIRAVRDFFPTAKISGEQFDWVIAFSCLEHVEDPLSFLKAILAQLSPTGRAFLTFPDVGEMLRNGDLNAFVHEHMSYFDEASCRNLAGAAGFDVTSLSSKNGLFSVLLRKAGQTAPWSPDRKNDGMEIGRSYQAVKDGLTAYIGQRLAQGEAIGFHGACPGLNNFLWLTGLGENPRIIIADGDASKWGSFLPAAQGAIRPPDDPDYLASDFIFIAATNFIDGIKHGLHANGVPEERMAPLTLRGIPSA
jgi:SAM-dependent methyltransferase